MGEARPSRLPWGSPPKGFPPRGVQTAWKTNEKRKTRNRKRETYVGFLLRVFHFSFVISLEAFLRFPSREGQGRAKPKPLFPNDTLEWE
jgi:hypothetical protein